MWQALFLRQQQHHHYLEIYVEEEEDLDMVPLKKNIIKTQCNNEYGFLVDGTFGARFTQPFVEARTKIHVQNELSETQYHDFVFLSQKCVYFLILITISSMLCGIETFPRKKCTGQHISLT